MLPPQGILQNQGQRTLRDLKFTKKRLQEVSVNMLKQKIHDICFMSEWFITSWKGKIMVVFT